MAKKAIIVISLIEEADEKIADEIEREIAEELSKWPAIIPWMKKIEKVSVVEEN